MKNANHSAGWCACYDAILNALLPEPVVYEPFTDYFDSKKLAEVRDEYGADLYAECYPQALEAVTRMGNAIFHLRSCGVLCNAHYGRDAEAGRNRIEISGLGNLTEARIHAIAARNGLSYEIRAQSDTDATTR